MGILVPKMGIFPVYKHKMLDNGLVLWDNISIDVNFISGLAVKQESHNGL